MLDFHDIPGQEAIKTHFLEAIRNERVSHAYMIIGEAGMGKFALSEAFARTLLCEKGGMTPCGVCHACRQVMAGVHPDLIRITHEKPSVIGVDEVRSQISDTVGIRPFSGKKKIYIIPDAEKMSVQAQNALLKTIEEPPEYAVLILLTENDEVLLETIRSRTVKLKCRPLSDEELIRYLIEKEKTDPERASVISGFARGNPGKAVQLSSSEDFRISCDENLKLLSSLPGANMEDILKDIDLIKENNKDIPEFLSFLRIWIKDLMICKKQQIPEGLTFSQEEKNMLSMSGRMDFQNAGKILEETERTEDRIKANVNPELALEILLLTVAEKIRR